MTGILKAFITAAFIEPLARDRASSFIFSRENMRADVAYMPRRKSHPENPGRQKAKRKKRK